MIPPLASVALLVAGIGPEGRSESPHAANSVYQSLISEGWTVGATRISLPAPALSDGESADAERAALQKIAGSERAAADLTRDSVSAPFVLKTRDEPAGIQGTIRVADLWFVVRARLDDIDPEKLAGGGKDSQTTEAANMRFTASRLSPEVLARLGNQPTAPGVAQGWYVHLSGRLLDRIHVEATDRIVATKSETSWRIASRTDPAFNGAKTDPNRWFPIVRKGSAEEQGKAETYPGGVSYVNVSRLETVPGALLVEAHFAFFEPKPWFDGAPILRSKIGVVAQDRIRALRRERAKGRKTEKPQGSSGTQGG